MRTYTDEEIVARIEKAMHEVLGNKDAKEARLSYEHARERNNFIVNIKRQGTVIGKISFYKGYFNFAKDEDIRMYCIRKTVEITHGPIIHTASAVLNRNWDELNPRKDEL